MASDSVKPPKALNLKFLCTLESKGMSEVLNWCMGEGLIPSMHTCSVCLACMKLIVRNDTPDGFAWVCRKKGINKHYIRKSVRKGTFFEESKLSICDILRIAYLWVYGAKRDFIKVELGITNSKTLAEWSKRFRSVCVEACLRENQKLGGHGITVNLDECKFGPRKYGKGRKSDSKWVFGGVEKGTRNYFFEVVSNKNKEALLEIIKKYILPGTTVISDCWKTYNCFTDHDYMHLSANHSLNFKSPESEARTNTVVDLWNLVKQDFRHRRFRRTSSYFESYFAEFMWRSKYKERADQLFPSFLASVRRVYSVYFPQKDD